MKKISILAIFILVALMVWFFFLLDSATAPTENINIDNKTENLQQESAVFDKNQHSIDEIGSVWQVVNKQRPLPDTYKPSDLQSVDVLKRTDKSDEELSLRKEPAQALEELFNAAEADNISLLLGSAYRSYELQKQYYDTYVSNYGQEEADRFSARPGTSEHQTGLVADLSGADRVCYLEECFSERAEGQWLAQNAHTYGFIIRYPKGKEAITGYQYEPWHIRYVGRSLAQEIFAEQTTMEEFFGL